MDIGKEETGSTNRPDRSTLPQGKSVFGRKSVFKIAARLYSAAQVVCWVSGVALAASRGASFDDHYGFEMRFEPPPSERHGYVATGILSSDVARSPIPSQHGSWPAAILDPNRSPVDLSFLNAPEIPSGRHGFLRARGDKLVFDDGTVGRFWGANLAAYSLFETSQENVRRQAHRLSQLGFNLIRLHHHDSEWVDPNIFGSQQTADTQTLHVAMLERLDWWIKCLEDEGIYIWLDLEDGRRFKQADKIEGFEEISRGKPSADLKGYNYVNQSIETTMKRFNNLYLNHQNRYTGLRYKDDPAIAMLLITNENDVTNHFGSALLPDKNTPRHTALYMRRAEEFADKHSLPRDKVWRAWEAGPSKLFLNDLEERFDIEMLEQLRTLGVKVPVVPTSTWGMNPLSSLPALTAGDIIDAHSYGGAGELERNPVHAANLVSWIAAAQIVAKPLSVTEWGLDAYGTLATDRQDIPLYVAASAAMQGWDALMFYAYSQEALGAGKSTPSVYHAYNDPAMMATLPAAALLYRQGHVREASTTYVFAPNEQALFYQSESPADSVALRTAAERGRLLIAMPKVPELPWLETSLIPMGAKIIQETGESQIPLDSTQVVSDSGELRRNWKEGVFTIDTPRTQAAMGWIGGKTITLADVQVELATSNAVIAVQSLDGNPLRRSQLFMISVAARSAPNYGNVLLYFSEPVAGRILLTAVPGLNLGVRHGRTGRMRHLRVAYDHGRYVISLDQSLRSCCLLLEDRPLGNLSDSRKSSQ